VRYKSTTTRFLNLFKIAQKAPCTLAKLRVAEESDEKGLPDNTHMNT
jgi:hypothetical protein